MLNEVWPKERKESRKKGKKVWGNGRTVGDLSLQISTVETFLQTEYDFDFSPHFTLGCQIAFCPDDISFTGKKVERLRNEAAAALHARHEEWHHHLGGFAGDSKQQQQKLPMQIMTPTPSDPPTVPVFVCRFVFHRAPMTYLPLMFQHWAADVCFTATPLSF